MPAELVERHQSEETGACIDVVCCLVDVEVSRVDRQELLTSKVKALVVRVDSVVQGTLSHLLLILRDELELGRVMRLDWFLCLLLLLDRL